MPAPNNILTLFNYSKRIYLNESLCVSDDDTIETQKLKMVWQLINILHELCHMKGVFYSAGRLTGKLTPE